MRIGLVGLGSLTRIYLRHLGKLNQSIAAVCDINESRAVQVAQEQGCAAYTDYREMLEREWLDAVFVAIPPAAHTTQVADIALSKCAVFVSPPVGLNLEQAIVTAAEVRKAGVVNQVGYHTRHADITLEAMGMIRTRPLTLGFGRFLCRMSPLHPWWGKGEVSGGQLIEQSTNVFDLLRYFMGEVESVHAFGHRGAAEDVADFEDSSTVNLRFKSGAVGSVVSTSIARAPEGYAAEFSGKDLSVKLQFDHRLTGWIDGEAVDYNGDETGYRRQIEAFLRAVEEKNPAMVRCSYEDAVRTLAVTVAATRSLESGQVEQVEPVALAPEPAANEPDAGAAAG